MIIASSIIQTWGRITYISIYKWNSKIVLLSKYIRATNKYYDIEEHFFGLENLFMVYWLASYPGFQSLRDVSIYYLLSKALESRVLASRILARLY
jgi:hypothetical protein